jgi:hypothetical protein
MSCASTGPRRDDKDAKATCFCDEECNNIGDCCLDYRTACKAIDCEMSPRWTDWSECDARCGYGVQQRTRQILLHPSNGGKMCGDTVERRLCEGTNCKLPRSQDGSVSQLKETASIVPASYGGFRTDALYSPFEDIRQNLFSHFKYEELKRDHSKPSYCAKFRVTENRAACLRAPTAGSNETANAWARQLVRGSTVCVECQQFAALQAAVGRRCAGHGVLQRETTWKAVTIPRCNGKWTLISRHETPCTCDPHSDASFVFV